MRDFTKFLRVERKEKLINTSSSFLRSNLLNWLRLLTNKKKIISRGNSIILNDVDIEQSFRVA
jgi:hypothetical protein